MRWKISVFAMALGLSVLTGLPKAGASHLVPKGTDDGVRLEGLSIHASLSGRGAKTILYLRFANHGSGRAAQATLLFPLPPGAAVQRLRLKTGDRWMEGEISGRVQGKKVYDRLYRRAIDPALLAQAGEDQYRLRVFPIARGGEAEVEITYWHLLPEEDGTLYYAVPFDLADVHEAAPHVPVSLHVSGQGLGRCRVRVPEYWRGAKEQASENLVTIACPERWMDLSGEIEIALTPRKRPPLLVARYAEGRGHFYLRAQPEPLDGRKTISRRFIFCIDRSGSMRGEKIVQAREALVGCLRAMGSGDEFNLVTFSGTVGRFTDRMESAGEMRAAALKFVREIEAKGNTDIRSALLSALEIDVKGEKPLDIILISDGQQTVGASTAEAVLDPVRAATAKRGAPVRVSVVGIGRDVDAALLRRLADLYEGERAFVTAEHAVAGQIEGVLARLQSARMERVRVSVEGAGARLATPAYLPNASFGSPVAVAGTYAEAGEITVRLAWHEGARERTWLRTFRPPEKAGGYDGAPLLAAAARADALESEITQTAREDGRVRRIIEIGRTYRLVTRYTSLIALETDALYRQQGVARPERDTLGIAARVGAGDIEIERRFDRQTGPKPSPAPATRPVRPSMTRPSSRSDASEFDMAKPRDLFKNTVAATAAVPAERPFIPHDDPDAVISDHLETDDDMDVAGARGDENAFSTTPLGGTGVVGSIGVDGGGAAGVYGFRNGGGRRKCVRKFGGSRATEGAVEVALKWLAEHQEADGSWNPVKHGATERVEAQATGLAVLTFLGAGYTHGTRSKYKENMTRALVWIMDRQGEDGSFTVPDANAHHAHAILALALSETYGMTRDEKLRGAAQRALDHAARKLQVPYGGWGRKPRAPEDALSTAWFVFAFKSAKVAGLRVDGKVFQGAMSFLEKVRGADLEAGFRARPGAGLAPDAMSSMAGACAMLFMGARRGEIISPMRWSARRLEDLRAGRPTWLYLGTLTHFQAGGEDWRAWNASMKKKLVESQVADGFWPAVGAAKARGRLWTTVANAMCLEVYYRYLPMYGS